MSDSSQIADSTDIADSSANRDGLPGTLRFLRNPGSYGAPLQTLCCIETHMSWVFLLSDRVFKLKKPVRFPFLDFSSLQAREFSCREELRLNARLAPGVYLGLMALQRSNGKLRLVPESQLAGGEILDWLVVMRRLPSERMLDQLIAHGMLQEQEIDALVTRLGDFYRHASNVPIEAESYLSRFTSQQALAREILLRPQFALRDAALALTRFDLCLSQGAALLRQRAAQARVLEGHGDLRPEHVCLLQPPVVIDCLEFNPQMRQVDPFDEISYLALECQMVAAGLASGNDQDIAGQVQGQLIAERLISGLAAVLDERPDPALLHIYTAHRAILRARLAMAHLLDVTPRTPEKWAPLAQRYLDRALLAIQQFSAAMHGG
jgi:aminoglycoside phosphotransferase family enzyme